MVLPNPYAKNQNKEMKKYNLNTLNNGESIFRMRNNRIEIFNPLITISKTKEKT